MTFGKSVWIRLMLVVALVGGMAGTAAADDLWMVDFAKAKEKAAKEGKDLLLEFTGSDWCPPCMALAKNVLTKDVFREKTPEKFVLVKLDNPRDKSKQSDEEQAQYKELSARYKVQGVPTIILADAEGRPYASKVGYGGTAAEEYVETLISEQKTRVERDELLAKAKEAEGVEKAKLLDKALSGIDQELAVNTYGDIIDQIVAADSQNEAGLKEKYEGLAKSAEFNSEMQKIMGSIASADDIPKALTKLEDLIAKQDPKGETLQQALYLQARLTFQSDKDKGLELLDKALKAAPESEMADQIRAVTKQLKAQGN